MSYLYNAAIPIFTVVVAGLLLLDERPAPLKLSGVALGFIGMVVMIGVSAFGGGKLLVQFAIVAATLSYVFAGGMGEGSKL